MPLKFTLEIEYEFSTLVNVCHEVMLFYFYKFFLIIIKYFWNIVKFIVNQTYVEGMFVKSLQKTQLQICSRKQWAKSKSCRNRD